MLCWLPGAAGLSADVNPNQTSKVKNSDALSPLVPNFFPFLGAPVSCHYLHCHAFSSFHQHSEDLKSSLIFHSGFNVGERTAPVPPSSIMGNSACDGLSGTRTSAVATLPRWVKEAPQSFWSFYPAKVSQQLTNRKKKHYHLHNIMFFMNLRSAEVLSKCFSSPAVLLEGRDFLTVDPVPHQKKICCAKGNVQVTVMGPCNDITGLCLEYWHWILTAHTEWAQKGAWSYPVIKTGVSSLLTLLSTPQLISYVTRNRFQCNIFCSFTLWKCSLPYNLFIVAFFISGSHIICPKGKYKDLKIET